MIRIIRPATPNYLVNYKKWGLDAFNKKMGNPNYKINWRTYKNQKTYPLLLNDLKQMTKNHCSFCDSFPLDNTGATIEHFRPKAIFPKIAYCWFNLFYCCSACQKKGDNFDKKLLKPDKLSYSFDRYFVLKTNNMRIFIEAKPTNSKIEIDSANYTIETYGLNKYGRPESRYITLRQFKDSNNPIIEEFRFRYLF